MDFQSLNRRELQALCKLNKIPANITNVAMADALKSLDIVEGIEEFLKPSQSETAESSVESPEKTEVTSPRAPCTGYRTSTRLRRKKEEAQCLTRTTRRGTRTEVQQTPEVSSSRRSAAIATSACRNVEKQLNESEEDQKNEDLTDQENKFVSDKPAAIPNSTRRSVRLTEKKIYSTRRSVRLTEKKLAETSVMERKIIEAIKMDLFSNDFNGKLKEVSDDLIEVSEDQSESGISSSKISQEGLENTLDSEVSSNITKNDVGEENVDQCKLDNSKEKFEDMSKAFDHGNLEEKLDSGEENDSKAESENVSNTFEEPDVALVPDEHSNKLVIEKDGDLEDKLHDGEEKVDLCESEIYKAQAEELSKAFEQLVAVSDSKEHSERFLVENGDVEDKINDDENDHGYLDTKTEMFYERENAFDFVSGENLGADNIQVNTEITSELLKSENEEIFSTVEGSLEDTVAAEMRHQVPDNNADMFLSDIESPNEQELSVEFAGLAASMSPGNVPNDSVDFHVSLQSMVPRETNEPGIEGVVSGDLAKTEIEVCTFEEPTQVTKWSNMNYEKDQEIMSYPVGFSDEEWVTDNEEDGNDKMSCVDANPDSGIEDMICSKQSEGDSESTVSEILNCKQSNEDADQTVVNSANFTGAATDKVTTDTGFYSENSIKKESGLVDTLSVEEGNQFPSVLATNGVDHPTHLTPLKEASTKTPTTVGRMALVSDDKENIDQSGRKLHLTIAKDEGKKNKKEKVYNDTSLRQLRKLLKNLEIKDKVNTTNEEANKAVKTPRPALQVLPDNRLVNGEMEN